MTRLGIADRVLPMGLRRLEREFVGAIPTRPGQMAFRVLKHHGAGSITQIAVAHDVVPIEHTA